MIQDTKIRRTYPWVLVRKFDNSEKKKTGLDKNLAKKAALIGRLSGKMSAVNLMYHARRKN